MKSCVRGFLGLLLLQLGLGCAPRHPSVSPSHSVSLVRIGGSDTMLILTRLWAEEYMKRNAGVSVYAEGGGTASGVRELITGKIDICAASRPLRPEEVQRLARGHGTVGLTFAVAKEALSIYVHPDNPVKDLTLGQLKEIFTGTVRNWEILGGEKAQILVVTRSPNSGTYLYFQEHILNEEPYFSRAKTMPNTQSVVDLVRRNRFAIGYGGIAYGPELHCMVESIFPTPNNIGDGSYPITRYLYLITPSTPRGEIKEFIDWVLSPAGQVLVDQAGYVPLWSLLEAAE